MAAAAAPSLAVAAGVGGSSLPVIPNITSGESSRIQEEEERPVVIRNIYKPKFMVKTPTIDYNHFPLDAIELTEEYKKWTAPEVAQEVAPMPLSKRLPYYIIGVQDDGWCMYRAWAYAHSNEGKRSSPRMAGAIFPEISEMQLWRLAHGMVAQMKAKGYKPEGMVVIDGKTGAPKKDATGATVNGWPTQYGANADEDHIDIDGTPRRFTTDLYDGLLTLYKPNDISKGPLVWPTQDMIRYLDMLLPNAITFIYQPPPPPEGSPPPQYRNFWDMYRNTNRSGRPLITCKDGHLCDLKAPVDLFPANMAPRDVIPNALLLFNGRNHYDVLKLDIPVGIAESASVKIYGVPILELVKSQRGGVFIDKNNIDYLISDAALTGPYRAKEKIDAAARDAINREYNLGAVPLSPLAASPPLSPHIIDMALLADAAQALLTGAQNLHSMSAGAPAAAGTEPNLREQIAALPNTNRGALLPAPQVAAPAGLIDTVRRYIEQANESLTAIKALEKAMPTQIIDIRVAAENAYRTLGGILTNLQSTSPTATLAEANAALQQVLDAHANADASVSAALAASVAAFPVVPTGVPVAPAAPAAAAVPFDRTQYLTVARVAEASALSSAVRARDAAQRINSDQATAMAAEVLERAKAATAAKKAVEAASNFIDADVNARAAKNAADNALAGANALEALAGAPMPPAAGGAPVLPAAPEPPAAGGAPTPVLPTPATGGTPASPAPATGGAPVLPTPATGGAPAPAAPAAPVLPAVPAPVLPAAPAAPITSPLARLTGMLSTAGPAPPPPRRAPGAPLPAVPASVAPFLSALAAPPSAAPALALQPGVAGIFVLDGSNNLFVQKRGAEGSYAGKLGIPMGGVNPNEDYAAAAIRELAEEAQLTPAPTPATLKLIYTTTLNGKSAKFYLYRPAVGFTIAGPDVDHAAELVQPFPVADVSGVSINAAFTAAGYIGVKPTDLLQFLNGAGAPLATDFIKSALAVLQRYTTTGQPSLGAQLPEVPEGDIPQWASGYFDVASLRDCSGGGEFIGPECASRAIFRDIMVAEEFKKTGRLAVRPNSGATAYNKLVAEIAALQADGTDPVALETKKSQLEEDYGDIPLWISDPATGVPRVMPLPNPYRAMASREQATTFANPAGGSGDFSAKNVAVLSALVGPKGKQMLEDSKFATSLLEALWFCGQGHVMNDKARCYPAMVLAELREQEMATAQRSAGEIAKELKWPLVMEWGQKLLAEFKGVKAVHAAMEPAPIAGPAAPAEEEEAGVEEVAAPASASAAKPGGTAPHFGQTRGHNVARGLGGAL
jgi:8-oxo-dGTP pyrophosphatase MutT (NUDIX family)